MVHSLSYGTQNQTNLTIKCLMVFNSQSIFCLSTTNVKTSDSSGATVVQVVDHSQTKGQVSVVE